MKRHIVLRLLFIALAAISVISNTGCQNSTGVNPSYSDDPVDPTDPDTPIDPVDPAFWFGEIYDQLIVGQGEVLSDEYPPINEGSGVNGAQIVNMQYVCNKINAKWGTALTPAGTATQAANCEYLLKMIDEANDNSTTFGTSGYATKQVVDTIAVQNAVDRLWVPGSKFVAVGGGKSAHSTDGISWTETTMPGSANWTSVAYGNNMFVTVASGSDKAAYSTDGISWTEATMPSLASWHSIAYGNGMFVTVANTSDKAAYSTDGINWTASTMPSDANWISVTYGNGKFVAVTGSAKTGDKTTYSTDGINWSPASPLPGAIAWSSVAYGNGKFVAVANTGNTAVYSTDGINWTAMSIHHNGLWTSITYGNGNFVAVGNKGDVRSICSRDGINWNPANPLLSSNNWRSVCYDGN
jgi:hypothetical protein